MSFTASASSHYIASPRIDTDANLGINLMLYSSDGLGNFTLRIDEYFTSDMTPSNYEETFGIDPTTGSPWGGGPWSSIYNEFESGVEPDFYIDNQNPYGHMYPYKVITGDSDFILNFQGIVDFEGNPTSGFGPSQASELFINDATDAAQYSQLINFSISEFDPILGSSVRIGGNGDVFDCCPSEGEPGDHVFANYLSFDPSVVVIATTPLPRIPVPAAVWLFASGLVGLVGLGRKFKKS